MRRRPVGNSAVPIRLGAQSPRFHGGRRQRSLPFGSYPFSPRGIHRRTRFIAASLAVWVGFGREGGLPLNARPAIRRPLSEKNLSGGSYQTALNPCAASPWARADLARSHLAPLRSFRVGIDITPYLRRLGPHRVHFTFDLSPMAPEISSSAGASCGWAAPLGQNRPAGPVALSTSSSKSRQKLATPIDTSLVLRCGTEIAAGSAST